MLKGDFGKLVELLHPTVFNGDRLQTPRARADVDQS